MLVVSNIFHVDLYNLIDRENPIPYSNSASENAHAESGENRKGTDAPTPAPSYCQNRWVLVILLIILFRNAEDVNPTRLRVIGMVDPLTVPRDVRCDDTPLTRRARVAVTFPALVM